ncbi:MAG: DUF4260 domain-containing protein [Devosia sp.]
MEKAILDVLVLWQRAEGALVFAAAMVLFWQLGDGLAWWSAILLFFAPDLSFAAYGLGPRFGAAAYNLVHIYGLGLCVLAGGLALSLPLVAGLGALWLGHAGFDRALGYGLKSPESFSLTHLGRIGKHR